MKRLMEQLKKMDRTGWLALWLCGALLLILALPADRKQEAAVSERLAEQPVTEDEAEAYKKKLVKELEETLACMDGAGKVRAMITFTDCGEDIVEKDVARSETASQGMAEGGAEKNIQYEETAVYREDGSKEPYVSRRELPQVEGVLVIAQGGGNSKVKQNIQEAVMALFSIEAHKIKIVKMENES